MKPEELDVVRLLRPLPEHNLAAGSRGAVVMDHAKYSAEDLPPAYEVEFAVADGVTWPWSRSPEMTWKSCGVQIQMGSPPRLGDGRSVAEVAAAVRAAKPRSHPCLRLLDDPFLDKSGLVMLHGSLAPRGAIFKRSAAPRKFWTHRGPAIAEGDFDLMVGDLLDLATVLGCEALQRI